MRLVLIRHGASSHAARSIIADVAGCQGLTEHGQAQALALAERLRATGELHDCSVLLCSPVARARQTAELLAGGLPVATITIDDELRELHPGAADGLTWAEYRTRYGEFDPQAAPTRPFAPGGESWDQFLVRVQTAHQRLADQFAEQTVVAVSHAGFIVASLFLLFQVPWWGRQASLEPTPTALTEWQVSGSQWRLVRYNDAGHLAASPHEHGG